MTTKKSHFWRIPNRCFSWGEFINTGERYWMSHEQNCAWKVSICSGV